MTSPIDPNNVTLTQVVSLMNSLEGRIQIFINNRAAQVERKIILATQRLEQKVTQMENRVLQIDTIIEEKVDNGLLLLSDRVSSVENSVDNKIQTFTTDFNDNVSNMENQLAGLTTTTNELVSKADQNYSDLSLDIANLDSSVRRRLLNLEIKLLQGVETKIATSSVEIKSEIELFAVREVNDKVIRLFEAIKDYIDRQIGYYRTSALTSNNLTNDRVDDLLREFHRLSNSEGIDVNGILVNLLN